MPLIPAELKFNEVLLIFIAGDVYTVIVNVLSDASFTVPLDMSLTLTRHSVDIVFGIVHSYVPLFGVDAITSVQFEPLLVEYSIFTWDIVPVFVQVIFCEVPTPQLSPPFGEVRYIVGKVADKTNNLPLFPLAT